MASGQAADSSIAVHARNVGGIDETTVTVGPGVTVLSGRNATNRTSFLQAVMAGLGSDAASLKGDADEGSVTLTMNGTEYTRSLIREDGGVTTSGDPYLEDSMPADLFAFLLESNEVRRTVERDGDLRDLVMRPVDTDDIEREIDRLREERADVEDRLAELDELAAELPKLTEERHRLDAEIEATQADLAETEADIEAADADVDETRAEREQLESHLDDLQALRSDLDDVRFQLDSNRESIDALREERADLRAEREDLPPVDGDDVTDLEAAIDDRRERKRALESTISDLRRIVQFNERQLDDEAAEVLEAGADDEAAVTDRLLEDEAQMCWTCGSTVEPGAIESTLDTLRELTREKTSARNRVDDELDELTDELNALESRRDRRAELEDRLQRVEADIENRTERAADLEDRKEELAAEIEPLEAAIDDLQTQDSSDVLDLHREANQLEFELERLEDERADVREEIESIEARLEERADIEARREEIRDELAALRTKVDRIEAEVVESFNEHMDAVLARLGYDNLDRVWLERRTESVTEGRRTVEATRFDLHIVRSGADDSTYEDALGHLSESEREVTGLVFALAGYLAHEVYETVPFMLLDSLEAIDSERIASLVEYLGEFNEYLVVALLPEDAAAVPEDHLVTEI